MSMMVQSGRFAAAGGGGTPGAYRSHRWLITKNGGDNSVAAQKIRMRETAGGAEVPYAMGFGVGTPSQSSDYGAYVSNPWVVTSTAQYGAMNTGGHNFWLRWSFNDAKEITAFDMASGLDEATRGPKDFSIQYSDDGSAWTNAASWTGQTWANPSLRRAYTFASVGAHLHWRINVTAHNGGGYVRIGMLAFRDQTGKVLTAANGEQADAFASSVFNNSYPATSAFDNVDSLWVSQNGPTPSVAAPHSIGINLPDVRTITQFTWQTENHGTFGVTRGPKDFLFQGWDGSAWVTIKAFVGVVFVNNVEQTFNI